MFVSESLNVNEKNHLQIGGVDAVELAELIKNYTANHQKKIYAIKKTAISKMK